MARLRIFHVRVMRDRSCLAESHYTLDHEPKTKGEFENIKREMIRELLLNAARPIDTRGVHYLVIEQTPHGPIVVDTTAVTKDSAALLHRGFYLPP